MNMQQTCDPDRLDAFVRGELSEQQESELTAHLDQCAACGEELERRVAAADQWREAGELLTHRARRSNVMDLANDPSTNAASATSNAFAEKMDQVVVMLAPTDDPEMLGRIGVYEVSGVIGCGGMGVVFKAHDRSLDRVVAIKVMAPHLAGSGAARKRFARESKAAAAVLHPNVIAIHCVADDPKLPYLVMPYIGGASLQKRVESDGPLCTQDTLRIGQQIAAGLAAAHAQGLVHRDIKPANILLERGVERVTITDFGLARAVDDATMTRSGVIAGTPQYMSPEQARGESIDHRSDLFSLGSVLYMMCAGHSPFRAETTFGILRRITDNQPRPLREINPDVPEWLCAIIEKLHAKDPSERFQSAEEVGELLEDCLAHVQQPATTPLPISVEQLSQLLPEATTAPQPAKKQLRQLFSNLPPIGKYIAAAAGAIALMFAGILIVLELGKGTLTIESEMENVPIRIVHRGEVVERLTVTKSGNSVRVAAGTYVVELETKLDGMVVENDHVSLKRGGTEHVMIRFSTQNSNVKAGIANQPAMESTDSVATFSAPGERAKIMVDVYGGNRVLGQNNAKYAKLVQDLNAIDGVQVNFREAGPGNDIVLAIVRDHTGLMTNSTSKPSTRRDAIAKALAQVPTVRWEEGPTIGAEEAVSAHAEEAVSAHSEIVPATIDPERANNAVKRVMQYLTAVQERDSEKTNTMAKGLADGEKREQDMATLLTEGGIPKHYKTWFVNNTAVVVLGPVSSSDKQMNGRLLLFTLSLVDERWSIVDIDLEVEERLLERFKNPTQAVDAIPERTSTTPEDN